jgi:hypothetical protein
LQFREFQARPFAFVVKGLQVAATGANGLQLHAKPQVPWIQWIIRACRPTSSAIEFFCQEFALLIL